MYLEKTLNSVENNSFVVEIFGLGYVGFPLAVKWIQNYHYKNNF